MSYYNRRYRGRSYRSRSRDIGLERALQHIHEAEQLSRELGGTDKDVKEYFFSLSGAKLDLILDTYGHKYGEDAKKYAKQTMPKWKSGSVKMSGLVASRLFSLLPPTMPLQKKYELVKNLWEKYGPHSDKRLRFGPQSDENEVFQRAQDHLLETIVNYKIPDPLESRFKWLSAGDIQVKQDLLNHFLNIEKQLIINGLKNRLPVIFNHIRNEGNYTQRITQDVKIGNHKLTLMLDPKTKVISLENPSTYYSYSKTKTSFADILGWIFWGVIIFIFFSRACSH